eukprot:2294359-Amphidinium_carterae.1
MSIRAVKPVPKAAKLRRFGVSQTQTMLLLSSLESIFFRLQVATFGVCALDHNRIHMKCYMNHSYIHPA